MVAIIVRNVAGHRSCCRCCRHGVVGVVVVDVAWGRPRCRRGMGVAVESKWTWRDGGHCGMGHGVDVVVGLGGRHPHGLGSLYR